MGSFQVYLHDEPIAIIILSFCFIYQKN